MASQVITPENLKKTIDAYVEKEGIKAFLLSTEKVGTASAPSKRRHHYTIPVAVAEDFLSDGAMNLPLMLKGLYLVPVKDLTRLSDAAREAYDKNVKREGS